MPGRAEKATVPSMTPPDTPLAALPAAVPPPLRAAGPASPARGRGGRRLRNWMLLLSLLLHVALLCALLFVHRRLREAAVAPSFEVLFQPPGTSLGKPEESKPSELPAPALPPAPAPTPPAQVVPPPPTPTPPTPMPPLAAPPPPAAMPRALAPTLPQAAPPLPAPPSALPPSLPLPAAPPPPAPPLPRTAAPPLPLMLPTPAAPVAASPPPPAPPALARPPPAALPPSAAAPASSENLPPAVPLPAPPAPPKPAPAETPQVRLSLAPPEFAPPLVQTPAPQPARPPTPRRRPAFPLPINTSLGAGAAPSPSRQAQRGTGAIDLALGRATRDSVGAPPRDTNAESGDIVVHGAQVGKDWEELLHEWWLQHGFYPEEAARRGEDGRVSIHVRVDRYGHVQLVELENSSGSQWLDLGAQATFRDATLPPFPPSTPEPVADLDITIRYILVPR